MYINAINAYQYYFLLNSLILLYCEKMTIILFVILFNFYTCYFFFITGEAILSTPEERMVLADIYDYVLRTHAYYRDTKISWRNSIRHNLSVNPCFRKSRAVNSGRGYFWCLDEACVEDFRNGNFNRRQLKRRLQSASREPANDSIFAKKDLDNESQFTFNIDSST